MSNLPDFVSAISHADTISALIQDEYLHDPSTLPSNHLNVTVSVQDKDRERLPSVRRIVGKAVLDTANYSKDFISFTVMSISELSIHKDGGVSVGLHVLAACIATTNASIAMV